MADNRGSKLAGDYASNTCLIQHLTEGLSHAHSLVQPEFPANCMNWVLGHIVHRRNTALGLLGRAPVWDHEAAILYQTGSDPISSGGPSRSLNDLLEDLALTQRTLEEALESITEEELDRHAETDRGEKPVGEHLAGLHWHETFHIGQLDMLRSLALSECGAGS